jgi:hypothetical protein
MRKEQRDMNDKELDDFFRKKFGNPDIPYDPADWGKMKDKLDHSAKGNVNGSKVWFKGWIIPLVALMVLTGIGLGWKYMGSGSEKTVDTDSPLHSRVELNAKETDKRDIVTPMVSEDTREEGNKFSKPAADGIDSADPLAVKSGKDNDIPPSLTKTAKGGVEISDRTTDIVNLRPSAPEKPGDQMLSKINLEIKFHKDQYATSYGSGEGPFQDLSKVGNKEDFLVVPTPEDIKISSLKNEKRREAEPQFTLALLLAPDVSTLKIKDIKGLGTSIGFNMEYFIHPNISLNAGALYAFKTYEGGEVDYQGYGPSPSGISGNCWVLDIPLNLRYYVINHELDRWYVSGGISSYFMLREKYDLDYENYSGNIYTRKVEVENENRHYLGIVNLGIGYQRVLSDQLAIQVEPYLKLPIKGIGEGEINLKSTGVLVGLKYSW